MKIRFNKPVSVDYFSSRLDEWTDVSFNRNEEVEIERIDNDNTNGKWADLIFENGDLAADVLVETFTKVC